MTRIPLSLLSAALLAGALQAQTANPLATEMKTAYATVKTNLQKAAEKIPEADYAFKASPDIRSIGELIAHIAQSQILYCGRVKPAATPQPEIGTTKDSLVAALKASTEVCDAAWDSLTDANAMETVGTPGRGAGTRAGMLIRNTIHDNEEYGYLSVYLRIKGIIPPSSDTAGRGGR